MLYKQSYISHISYTKVISENKKNDNNSNSNKTKFKNLFQVKGQYLYSKAKSGGIKFGEGLAQSLNDEIRSQHIIRSVI